MLCLVCWRVVTAAQQCSERTWHPGCPCGDAGHLPTGARPRSMMRQACGQAPAVIPKIKFSFTSLFTNYNLLDFTTACGLLVFFPKQSHTHFSRKMAHTNRHLHTYRQGLEQSELPSLFQPKPSSFCDLIYPCTVLSGVFPLARYLPSPALQAAGDRQRLHHVSIWTFPCSGVSIRALAWLLLHKNPQRKTAFGTTELLSTN